MATVMRPMLKAEPLTAQQGELHTPATYWEIDCSIDPDPEDETDNIISFFLLKTKLFKKNKMFIIINKSVVTPHKCKLLTTSTFCCCTPTLDVIFLALEVERYVLFDKHGTIFVNIMTCAN